MLTPLEAGKHADEPDVWLTHPEYYSEVYDAITNNQLDPNLVSTARADEMTYLKELDVYGYDYVQNCIKETGKPPVPVTWVNVQKGDEDSPNVRARLCVCV